MNKRILISFIAIAVLAGGIGFAMWQQMETNDKADFPIENQSNDTSDERLQELDEEKHQRLEDENGTGDSARQRPDEDNQNETRDQDNNYDASIVLNNFGQQESGGTVYANATVDGVQEGTCEFHFSRGNSSITETSSIQSTPTGYYACGVQVEARKFSPKGEWTARVFLQGTDPQVRSSQRSMEIR